MSEKHLVKGPALAGFVGMFAAFAQHAGEEANVFRLLHEYCAHDGMNSCGIHTVESLALSQLHRKK
jgi:hypothetical protein